MKPLSMLALALLLEGIAQASPVLPIIAHRGASHAAPENTLSAFKLAWEEGADGIEADFFLSADGEVVCIHDKDTERVAGTKLAVTKTAWKDLAALDVGSWKSPTYQGERIPRLDDVLDQLPAGKMFFLEIKDGPRIVAPIRRILERKRADPARVFLISFDAKVIVACRKELPAYQAHWISTLEDFAAKRDDYQHKLVEMGAQGLLYKANAKVDSAWLAQLRQKGIVLTAWTIDDAKIARRIIDVGVDFISTNRPGPLRKELE
ncbi:MAG: glycerophosphodiester phosphodiesterase family protein [Verrucomicrobiota bacterium]